jgi:hypothetical protein
MYLFPDQEVSSEINDYLNIGAVVTYLKSGELVEDYKVSMPWVYVRSEKQKQADMGKGKEGWCFSHYLQMTEDENIRAGPVLEVSVRSAGTVILVMRSVPVFYRRGAADCADRAFRNF